MLGCFGYVIFMTWANVASISILVSICNDIVFAWFAFQTSNTIALRSALHEKQEGFSVGVAWGFQMATQLGHMVVGVNIGKTWLEAANLACIFLQM